jgi:hypothetical protein
MRLSELLHRPIFDSDGCRIGYVQDVRTEQDGPLLGGWGAALTVKGLLVTPRKWLSTLGYEAGHSQGPWLIRAATERLHAQARFVPWEYLVLQEGQELRITQPIDSLPYVKDV